MSSCGQLLLRWSASIAAAETFLLEGYDAVVSDDVQGDRLEDFLDLAAPETVHLVVLRHPALAADTPHWGLWVEAGDRQPERVAADVLSRLDDARVVTAERAEATGSGPSQSASSSPLAYRWLRPERLARPRGGGCDKRTSRTGRERAGRTRRGRSSATCGP